MNSNINIKKFFKQLYFHLLQPSCVAAVVSLIVSGIVPLYISNTDIKVKYMDIATQVLSTNKDCEDKEFRAWAVDVLNAEIPEENLKISDDIKQRLVDCKTRIPIFGSASIVLEPVSAYINGNVKQ